MSERAPVSLAEPFRSRKAPLDWWIAEDNPAQLVAPVDHSLKRLWVFTKEETMALAQQRLGESLSHLSVCRSISDARAKEADRLTHVHELEKYRLENRAHELFGV